MAGTKTGGLPVEDITDPAYCCVPLGQSALADDEARSLATAFKALADPVRIQILDALARSGGEICACDFVDVVVKSQPTVSHHLRLLREAGLVSGERRGTWVWYRLDHERFRQLRSVLTPAVAQQAV
ncbi:MAG: ArsR/SmtB family transcription factor [Nocardioidaceae bacterium]